MDFCKVIALTIFICVAATNSKNVSKISTKKLTKLYHKFSLCKGVNLREISVVKLTEHLTHFRLSSVDLVKCYQKRISLLNPYFKAAIQLNPDAVKEAELNHLIRVASPGIIKNKPLFGIPILLKDNMDTFDMMETTAGALALIGIKPKKNASVVKILKDAGLIILGKANMDEFASFRTLGLPDWSSRGGTMYSPYVRKDYPGGSSGGSAIAVTISLAPLSMGTDTNGSVIIPASDNSVVGLRMTKGSVSTIGIIPLSRTQDTVGPIASSVLDTSILYNVLSKNKNRRCFSLKNLYKKCLKPYNKMRVGFLQFTGKKPSKEQLKPLKLVKKSLADAGITVIDPVFLNSDMESMLMDDKSAVVFAHELKADLNTYLKTGVISNVKTYKGKSYEISSLSDIIKFNIENPQKYPQTFLIRADATDGLQNSTYLSIRNKRLDLSKNYLNQLIRKYHLDGILVYDIDRISIVAAAGYPAITIPIGVDKEGYPFGFTIWGAPNSEKLLLQLGFIIEKYLKQHSGFGRQIPKFLP